MARKNKKKLWFVPYRKFYRLTQEASEVILNSKPSNPIKYIGEPPEIHLLNNTPFNGTSGSSYGHWYGALVQIMPKEAFKEVGGWDERFRGWGGEDHAAMRAMDTLYWPHKTLPTPVYHIWHPFELFRKYPNHHYPMMPDISFKYSVILSDIFLFPNIPYHIFSF